MENGCPLLGSGLTDTDGRAKTPTTNASKPEKRTMSTFMLTGTYPIKIPAQSTCLVSVSFDQHSAFENTIKFYDPRGEPRYSFQRGDGKNHTFQIDNNSDNQITWVAWEQHQMVGQPDPFNDSYQVLSRNPPVPLPPKSIIVGYEDHGDNSYNDIHMTLNYEYQ